MGKDLSLEFIKNRFQTEDELNNVVFSKYLKLEDKIDYIVGLDAITREDIRVIFSLTPYETNNLIEQMLSGGAIKEIVGEKYQVIDHSMAKTILGKTFGH